MGMLKEFRDFAVRGNVVDLAVAVIIGAAFGKIVSSFVKDIIMPIIGSVAGVDFTDWKVVLKDGSVDEAGVEIAEVAITYGNFITTVVDFVLVAFAIFMMIKGINATKKKEEEKPAAPPEPSAEVKLLTEIRDALNK
jgi:large conductance mechanosensitive channel